MHACELCAFICSRAHVSIVMHVLVSLCIYWCGYLDVGILTVHVGVAVLV